MAAILRLFAEKKLHNSWEVQHTAYNYANGIKTLTEYAFVGNTFLGYEYADPAYGKSADVLSISQEDRIMVAEAISRDIADQKEGQEDKTLNDDNMNGAQAVDPETQTAQEPDTTPAEPQDNAQVAEPAATDHQNEENNVAEQQVDPEGAGNGAETSALTARDIRVKVTRAAEIMLGKWCWLSYLFPEEHKALLDTDETGRDELSYTQVDYAVNNDEVTVSNPVEVKLAVSVSQINQKVEELNNTIASLNEQLSEANDEIAALRPYREAQEKAEHDSKAAEIRAYAERSGRFTEEELNGEELSALFEALDMAGVKAMIADRVVASMEQPSAVETAGMTPRANPVDAAEDINYASVLKDFFARH